MNNETIADIVADLREHSGETTPGLVCFTEDGGIDFSALADRIEAAAQREIRDAAMEHAVLPAVCITKAPQGDDQPASDFLHKLADDLIKAAKEKENNNGHR